MSGLGGVCLRNPGFQQGVSVPKTQRCRQKEGLAWAEIWAGVFADRAEFPGVVSLGVLVGAGESFTRTP